jgi:hypothetical protein
VIEVLPVERVKVVDKDADTETIVQ